MKTEPSDDAICDMAQENYGTDELVVCGNKPERVEGGWWVTIQAWVSEEDFETEIETEPKDRTSDNPMVQEVLDAANGY